MIVEQETSETLEGAIAAAALASALVVKSSAQGASSPVKKRRRLRRLPVGLASGEPPAAVKQAGVDVFGSDGEEGMYVAQTQDDSLVGYSVRQKLRMLRLKEVDVPPDGHCGFWSMCFLLGLVRCLWHLVGTSSCSSCWWGGVMCTQEEAAAAVVVQVPNQIHCN